MVEPPLSREAFAASRGVSRETLARLTAYLDLLSRWQRAINLVGPATLADPWRRHILDSAQLQEHLPPGTASLVDLGSGAGFPGMVLAVLGVPGVVLIESDRRKAQFLREVARATGTEVTVRAERIEGLAGWPADVVTARALAPLPRLLPLAERFLAADSICLFLKGRNAERELTQALKSWHMVPEMFPSLSAPAGSVLKLRGVGRCA
ncbi:MAG TPA: 16S rRNA (guanine(527)-N(7))-methyltransferase RsmG [Geminicoccaceae bacterium]|nr:16S rRNA (guanine(527)-N(7))-methyltransferase RsmG [Geminicoccaceae bacterium]